MVLKSALYAAAASALAVSAPAFAVDEDFAARADALVKEAYPAGEPGAAVIVTEGGKVVYAGGSGMAHIDKGAPITPDTVFRLGSITKQFSAAVVLQLVAEGKLSLDDPLSKFVPGYPEPGAGATVHQLLNHTSGIASYTGIPGWMAGDKVTRPYTTAELIGEFRDQPADFAPGQEFRYNNSGYVLLGAVIEAATGKPWHEAIAERITKPLGLTTIRHGLEEANTPAFATGYTADDAGQFVPARPMHQSVGHAAGALIGTVGDLAKWSAALHGGKVVPAPLYAQMIAPTALPGGRTESYGFGIGQGTLQGLPVLSHGGGIFGFATNAVYVPEKDVFVAVFSNSDSGIRLTGIPMLRLAAEAVGKPIPSFTEVVPDLAALEPMFGVYRRDEADETRWFFARDGKLYTRRNDGADIPVHAAGGNRFFYGADSLSWFELAPQPDGGVALLMHFNGEGAVERARRTGPIPPEAASVMVPRAVLDSFAGSYTSAVAPIVVAVREGDVLTLTFGNQAPKDLEPRSETEFAAIGVNAKVEFTRAGGEVTGLVIKQNGRDLPATRNGDAATD